MEDERADIKTRFKQGNRAAEKWTLEESKKLFDDLIKFIKSNEEILSMQQAYIEYDIPHSTYYYLLEKFPVLDKYKKAAYDVIISRINIGALLNKMNPTAAIWRMKQSGELETKGLDITTKGESMNIDIDQRISEIKKQLGIDE